MRKFQRLAILTTACILMTAPVSAKAQDANVPERIVGVFSLNSRTASVADPETPVGMMDNLDASKGLYLLDEKGTVYYETPDGTVFCGGIAPDGYLYDADGAQVNTLTYIRDKYLEPFQSLGDNDSVVFDSEKEELLFLQYYQLEYAVKQGTEIFYTCGSDGKVAVRKGDITGISREKGENYQKKITEIADSLSVCRTEDEKICQAADAVSETFLYDEQYLLKDMNQAVRDGRGVCYHYVKLLHDVYEAAEIPSEYMIGQFRTSEGVHAWLNVYNKEEDRWVYVDPTALNKDRAGAMFRYAIPAACLDAYRPVTISGT